MSISLPKPIAEYLAAEQAGDAAQLARCFASDGVVHDEGGTFTGTVAIERWNAAARAKYHHTVRPSVRRCATTQPSSLGAWPVTFRAALSSSITSSGLTATRSPRWTSVDGDGRSRASGTACARHRRHERDRSSDRRPVARMWSNGAHDGADDARRFIIRSRFCRRRCRDCRWLPDGGRRGVPSTRRHRCDRARRWRIVSPSWRLRRPGRSPMATRT